MSMLEEMKQREADRAALRDPNVIHQNMLRGTIAKPTREQILHLYPEIAEEIAQLRSENIDYRIALSRLGWDNPDRLLQR